MTKDNYLYVLARAYQIVGSHLKDGYLLSFHAEIAPHNDMFKLVHHSNRNVLRVYVHNDTIELWKNGRRMKTETVAASIQGA